MEEKDFWLNLFFFLGVFLIVYVITYIFNLRKFKKKKSIKIGELNYLVIKFQLDVSKLNVRRMILYFSLIDAFIISFVTTFITVVKWNMIWQMICGFVLLFLLIYAFYEIYGRHLVKKGYQKKEGKMKR